VTIGGVAYSVPVVNGDTVATVAGKIVAVINASSSANYYGVATGAAMKFYAKTEGVSTDTFALTSANGTGVTVGSIVAYTKTTVTAANIPAFAAATPGVCLGVRLTSVPLAIKAFCSVNIKYRKLRATNLIVSLVDGFSCGATITTVQELQYSEGKGSDVKQLEYVDGGFNGKPGPYRVSELTNLPREGFVYYASSSVNYTLVDLTYDQMSVGGWLEYLNNLETVIAIPCADSTTLTGLIAVLDAIFTQFAPNTNDAAAIDCTNVGTSVGNSYATDGIESIS